MKVGERWAIAGNRGDFQLTERSVRKDPQTGQEKIGQKTTYHPTLEQCLNKIVKTESVRFVDEQMTVEVAALKAFCDELKQAIKEVADAAQVAVPVDSE